MKSKILLFLLVSFCFSLNIFAQTASPSFIGGANQSLTICENASSYVIDSYFSTYDNTNGLTLTYSIVTPPIHGTLHGFPGSGSSNSGVFNPSGFNYSPTTGYSGSDNFQIRVSDGISSAITSVSVTINTLPTISAITGTPYVCGANSSTLSNASTGGKWTSNSINATVDSLTGVVTGAYVGSATITYTVTNASGCSATASTNFVVSGTPLVASITGTGTVCVGLTTTLADATANGVWSSSNTNAATVNSSGVVTGVAAGAGGATISYTITNSYGCSGASTRNVTVSNSPTVNAITAAVTKVCVGSTITMTDNTFGGTWSSSNTALATVVSRGGFPSTATITGVSAGTDTILYTTTNGNGCSASSKVAITVGAIPVVGAINGTKTVCAKSTTQLSNTTSGGVWTTSSAAIATVSLSGLVTGVTAGNATITYTVTNATGCSTAVTTTVTVVAAPVVAAITGTNTTCVGSTTTLADATAGGTWTSSNDAIATVNTTGTVTGNAFGTDTIYYTVTGPSCNTTVSYPVTVSSGIVVPAIGGVSSVCTGSTATLTDATNGGVWSSSNTAVATVNASGVVTPVAIGLTVIKYTLGIGTCTGSAIKNVTINATPVLTDNNIVSTTICSSDSVLLTNTTSGGVWSTNNAAVATVSQTGLVKGVSATTLTTGIVYTVTNAYGCSATKSSNITVNAKPAAFTITGTNATCIGTSTGYSTSGNGGAWATSNSAVLRLTNTGNNATITGLTAGNSTVSYTVSNGVCSTVSSTVVTVGATVTVSPIQGASTVCVGTNSTYTDSTTGSGLGGAAWSVINGTGTATIGGTGALSPSTAGTVTVKYTYTRGACTGSDSKVVTIYPVPTVSAITGTTTVCVGNTTTLSDGTSGGKWSSGNTAQLVIDSLTGVATGVARSFAGVTVTYKYTNAGGCSASASTSVTVNAGTVLRANTGTTSLCAGSTTTLANTTAGGTWSSSNTAIATVNGSGVVSGVAAGTVVIQYLITTGGCPSYANSTITVNALPTVLATTGNSSSCAGSATALVNSSTIPTGGTGIWSSTNTSLATVSATGIVTTIAAGIDTINYKVTNTNTGCTNTAILPFTINANPVVAAISSAGTTVCVGSTLALTDATSGGTWGINDTSLAKISASGVVSGNKVGDVVVTYTVSKNGCTTIVYGNGTVEPLPVVAAITGTTTLCQASTSKLSSTTTGGVWTSSDTSIAKVDAAGTLTGIGAGNATITYTVTSIYGCVTAVTTTVKINPLPVVAAITGNAAICFGGTQTLGETTTGGVWSSVNTSIANINNTGLFTPVTIGVDTINYTVTNLFNCITTVSKVITINATPVASFTVNKVSQCLSGNLFVFNNTSTISAGSITYSWTIDGKNFTTTSPTYTFAIAGKYIVKLVVTSGTGCTDSVSQTITVNPQPVPTFTINNANQCLTGNSFVLTNGSTIASGTETFSWNYGDGTAVSTTTNPTHAYTKAGSYSIVLTATSDSSCVDSTSQIVTLTANVTPTVSISASATSICAGTSVTFTATPVNGGTTPAYQWKKNGVIVGTNSSVYSNNSLANGEVITCVLTSNVTCVTASTATSNSVTMAVAQYATPSVSISATSTTICTGTSVTFTATPSNGGVTPAYQWQKNGVNVGTNSTTYTIASLVDNDKITCILTSSVTCVTSKTATSNTVTITVNQPTTSTTNASICAGGSYSFNGTTYTTAGTYVAHLTNSVGCDSAATLNLTVKSLSTSTTNASICAGGSYTFNGTAYTTAGTYVAHLTNAVGCDSAATLVLTIKSLSTSTTNASICAGGSYTFNGTTYTKAGTYIAHLTNAVGCDSAATLNLTIKALSTSTTNASICAGASYTFNGTAYTTAGTYVAHLTNSVGCDSTATLNLTVKALSTSTTNASICAGGSYTFNGTAYTTAGTYVAHLTNAVGCDSAATLVLTIKALSTSTTNASICAGGSYSFNGTSYTTAGTYVAHLTNAVGCDSTATLNLTVKALSTSTTNASICAGASYTFNGTTYTTAGTYVAHLTNAVGCDSAATLNLTIKALSTSTTNASICAGASYTFNGTAYTTAGTYVAHLTNAVGCDSAATLNLTIKALSTSTTNASICAGGSYSFNGTTYTKAGSYVAHLTNAVGCDSAATLVLTIKSLSTSTTNASICAGASYTFNGTAYTTAGTYVAHLTNAVGCDSAATLNLTIKALSTSTTNASICAGASYSFNGTTYTKAGSYVAHLTNAVGCDSAATLNLTIKALSTSTTNASICAGASYTFNGTAYTTAGTYVAHLTNSVGCDSAATLNLTIKALSTSTTNASICAGGSYSFNGTAYTTAGTYIVHLTNAVGCDSAATLNLTVKALSTSTTNASICSGASYSFNGTTYTKSGSYVAHLTNAVGCDSAATLNLTVKALSSSTTNASICAGGSYSFNGTTYTKAGSYVAHLTNAVGCDSAATLNLTIKALSTSTTNASICAGASYTFNGIAYTTAGTYVAHLTNSVGCDSAATLNLTVKALSTSTTNASICAGASYTFNGTTYTTAGTYVAHLTNAVGCDSAARLNLTIKVVSTSTTNASICAGSSYIFNGTTYTTAGTYVAHLTNAVGCDSAATLNLTLKALSTSTTNASICAGGSYTFNGTTYTTAGTYVAHLTNAVGCDSAATLNLTIKALSTSTTNASICAGASYTFNGTAYTTAGTYVAHLTNAVGCDSAATLNLAIKALSTSTTNASICAGASYTFNGTTYTTAGTYVAHLTNAVGCDSAATLVLTIKALSTSTTNASICAGSSYTFNGTTYTQAGSYVAHLTNSVGCDSAATLNLSIKALSTSTSNVSICAGASYIFNGSTYTTAGTYVAHLTNAVGCDSAATLNLTIKALSTSTTNASICAGASYTFNGSTYTTAGTYVAHLTNAVGCDSAATLVLTNKALSTSTTNANICAGASYTFNGTAYTIAGTYVAHLTNAVGCDSAATLVLTIKALSTSTTNASICAGASYTFNGTTYTKAGTYIAHLTNAVGCDSAATLNLTVKALSTSTTNASICAGGSYTFNGTVYTTAGTYVAHLTNLVGCDSAATLNLTIKALSTSTTNASICAGGSYTFNGTTYTTAGTYVAHLTNSVGCDSAATLNLTIKALSTSTTNASICAGGSYSFNGNTYTKAGSYVAHLTNAVGCDSAATLNLTIKALSTSTTNASICAGASYTFNGTAYTTAGTYVAHLTNAVGCDSAATLNLTVKALSTSTTNASICAGASYTFNGSTYTTAGTYVAHLTNAVGCDSAATLNLTIMALSTSTTNASICAGGSYTFNGTAYTTAGTYVAHLTNAVGCDSAATLNLTLKALSTSTTNASICAGSSYIFNGTAYTTAGTYVAHLTNSVGCDSAATLNLTVKALSTSTTNASICAGASYIFNGTTYNTAGTYVAHLTNAVGCDSAATLNLTIKALSTSTTNASICAGGSYTFNGIAYTTAGTYVAHLTNAVGCDSAATLNLTIKALSTSTTNASICAGASYTFNGTTYTTAGTYVAHLTNAAGCDSAATLNLTIKALSTSSTNASICAGASYTFNGSTYTTAGTYIAHLTNAVGCDSAATLVLTIKALSTSTTNASICAGGSYSFNGSTYTSAGTYVAHLTNAVGCDSAATLNLTIKALSSSTTNASICAGASYIFNGTTYNTAGTYVAHLTNAVGCDSTATLNLTVKALSTSTTNASICTGGSYTFNGTAYTTAGTYVAHLTNSVGCDSAATLVLTVTPTVTPTVSITASSTTISSGSSVTFIAAPLNGGATPMYQWVKNGINISGANSDTLITSSLNNKDTITCILTSSIGCVTSISVTSNSIGITVNSLFTISGSVKNPLGAIIPTVTVSLNGTQSVTTDVNGNYSFTGSPDSSFVIMPSKNNDKTIANGVNGTDISLIQSHILKKVIFNAPYKLIAADVNSDGAVNGTDIALIKSLILKRITKFTGNKLWAFVDSSYSFPTPTKPFPFHDSISIAKISTNQSNQNFIGVKLGDVNYDWNSAILGANLSSTSIELFNDKIAVSPVATEVRVPVKVKNFKNIMGMQYTLNYNSDALELKAVENNSIRMDYNTDYASEGMLPILWVDAASEPKSLEDGTTLFELVFNKKGNLTNEDISLTSDITAASAFDGNYNTVGIVKSGGTISDAASIVSSDSWNVVPNPTKDGLVKVVLSLAKGKKVQFELTSLEGKLLMQQTTVFPVGNSSIVLDLQKQVRLTPGIYYLKAIGVDGVNIKQVLFVK